MSDSKRKNMTVGMLSLGCPKNLIDSEQLLGTVAQAGYSIVQDVTTADVALINTCAFVEEAREESYDMIFYLGDLKKENKIKHLIVCGCLPQRSGADREPFDSFVDGYIGTGDIEHIAEVLDKVVRGARVISVSTPAYIEHKDIPRFFVTPSFVKYVKVSEGCDHGCSFCIIPQLRGTYRSRPLADIVDEVRLLVKNGLKEVVLVSQDTSYYGKDREGRFMLPTLLRELARIDGLRWIRPLYLHPLHITDELLTVYREEEKVCSYIDMPLQHINDTILKSMRRGINKEETVALIARIRSMVLGVALRTAFIVGYPGESYEEFNELLKFIEDMRFERMGAFMYSHEEKSPAFSLGDQVSEEIKKSRFQDIMLLQQKLSRRRHKKLIGTVIEVLIEGENPDVPGHYIGRSIYDAPDIDGQIFVAKNKKIAIGSFYPVRIKDAYEYDLKGVLAQ